MFLKKLLFFPLSLLTLTASAQSMQLHYDPRHTIKPSRNSKNFPTLYFEYYKVPDSGKAFIKWGSFLFKSQADFVGDKNNLSKYYMQVTQEVRFWEPKVFLSLQYSGGLGVTNPAQYSYYIVNAWSVGISYHYKLGKAFLNSVLNDKYVPYAKPSNDFLFTQYFYLGLWNYKAEFSGDCSLWTENKNHGDAATSGEHGKRFSAFAEPQFWYKLNSTVAIGTKINTYYHVNFTDNIWEVYSAVAVRLKL